MKLAHKLGVLIGVLAALLLAPERGQAEQFQRFGDVVVHYNALSSDQLPPEVAKTYGFARSSRKGLLNIAVQREAGSAPARAIAARVEARASNLMGQRIPVSVREVRDGEAIYYLGEFAVAGTDTLRFEVDVTPEGATAPLKLRFSKDYVTD
ncbi:MAG TPA: DUF4426 domain-containing protein [Rhodanobacteraceae bacterium]|nr:DUF4426 domain-containing protein [Rhodanobacteraceae bacterium]